MTNKQEVQQRADLIKSIHSTLSEISYETLTQPEKPALFLWQNKGDDYKVFIETSKVCASLINDTNCQENIHSLEKDLDMFLMGTDAKLTKEFCHGLKKIVSAHDTFHHISDQKACQIIDEIKDYFANDICPSVQQAKVQYQSLNILR